MFPRRVNTFLVALPPGGAAFRFFVAFALAWEDGAESPYPIPADVAERLASPETRRAVAREILDAVATVAADASPDSNAKLGVVEFGDGCAYVPGGGTMEDDSMEHLPGFGNDVMMTTLERIVAKRRASVGAPPIESRGDVVAITSHHDRRPPGYVAATTPGRLFRLVAVACLASSAVLDVCPELAWGGEGGAFLSVTKDGGGVRGRAIVETVARLGAACRPISRRWPPETRTTRRRTGGASTSVIGERARTPRASAG